MLGALGWNLQLATTMASAFLCWKNGGRFREGISEQFWALDALPLGAAMGRLKSILLMDEKLRQQFEYRRSVPDAGERGLMPQGKGRSSFQARQVRRGNSRAEFAQREG
ncbi:hypothetical protein KIL84_021151 [Mauremys mutica]|uniref:Uncharacterized protein n=1 Tax=Mauremys mutica TaxID=74926 RepID=A0A9D3XBD3_9SAUR|nr:hypothetical protein KIL84_021151 [Mauremys mutica]